MEHQRNPNINYDTFKVGEHCGKLGYDAAAKIREDLWMLARAYGFADAESDRITRMNVLLNHIDYAHKQWNHAQSALDTQPNSIPLCATQGITNERVSSGDDQSKVREVDTQKPAGDVALVALDSIKSRLYNLDGMYDWTDDINTIRAALNGDWGGR